MGMFLAIVVPLVVALVGLSLSQGYITVSFADLGRALAASLGWGEPLAEDQQTTIIAIRLPRILIAVFGGAALAVAGTIMQAVFRNPLASPEILGTAQGSALGATVAMCPEAAPTNLLLFLDGAHHKAVRSAAVAHLLSPQAYKPRAAALQHGPRPGPTALVQKVGGATTRAFH